MALALFEVIMRFTIFMIFSMIVMYFVANLIEGTLLNP
uniref:Uncharacterized protein n=1 Tax=Myoviridae sp. ctZgq1 TaxID=2826666 RepID=A0A8S5LXJ2_9CAUD|nr:MAG TPA: hypothetical protein [Myoviridae sp. ctZgq1]